MSTLKVRQGTRRSALRRLATANGVKVVSTDVPGYKSKGPKKPYSTAEVAALWQCARTLKNPRQVSLRALLVLGFGCGLSRDALRGVSAASAHRHGDVVHVRSSGHCVPVLPDYVEELDDVCRSRPTGQLIGHVYSKNLTQKHVEMVSGRSGVPELSADRLRATWIVHHLNAGTRLVDLVAWAGLCSCEALDGYLPFADQPSGACSLEVQA